MKQRVSEVIAIIITTIGVAAALAWPFFHEVESVKDRIPPGARVVTLTGVAATGTWTEEDVSGGNYWRRDFSAARPVLQVGRPTVLRLKSADVMHAFYAPGLDIDTVEVYPGHVVEILVTPEKEGVFGYYCPTMCGDPHFGMRGVILVQGEAGRVASVDERTFGRFWLETPPSREDGRVARGAWLFRQKGCVTCHGPNASGGVRNWNYVTDTVPALDQLARKMLLFREGDVRAVVDLLQAGTPLEAVRGDPPVRRFGAVLAQYESVRNVIQKGNPAGKKDPEGPPPPLEMPAWQYRLTDDDMDSIIAYLLSLSLQTDEG